MARASGITSERAGRHVEQPSGYRAFIPAPLPPDPSVHLEGELLDLLSRADRALGRLDGSVAALPNPDLFVFMYVRKEAVLSSQIEGTQSSLQDLLNAEASVLATKDRPRDVDEVINYVHAMNYGLTRLESLPVSVRLIREIHAELLRGVRGGNLTPGDLRQTQNWIGPCGCTLKEATFVPPPHDELPRVLGELETFLHGKAAGVPLLVKVGLAHAQFETIHPFLDGNGRIGRLLITFLLTEHGALHRPLLYLSHYFKHRRQQYYEELQRVRDEGTWESWLGFFLEGVLEVSGEATEMARSIIALRETHRELVTASLGMVAGNGLKVLESLYDSPIISVKHAQDTIGTSYPAANDLIGKMVEIGILTEVTGNSRHRRFSYEPYVDLIVDGPRNPKGA